MPTARINTRFNSPSVDVIVDMGHPLLNRLVDGFIKVGGVGALHALTQETYGIVRREKASKRSIEIMAQRAGKEAGQWGLIGAIYTGSVYVTQEARGTHDWKNALIGGALTGAALSITDSNRRSDHIITSAITGAAIATAAEFLRNIT
ncbi:hypothetical protein KP509_20G035000 [Ceratopteris richardii]|uniref:Uncharacterized protein n=1 Tax=Ceratopteris richardii TaxID=49495 RepID=A0A8T2SHG2_CERRI|nr:hypothetical protein KP509_20G035000 [Ceratopteris richardii]KAH7331466.1 hypothetical protein KP509_20G035000 [Ceratopteris richardii]